MEAQEIEALALVGAGAIVSAMATDAWASTRDWTVELFRRHSPDRQAEVETQLEANAALVARTGDVERARGMLAGPWQLELSYFLGRHPEAAEDLTALADRIRTALPAASQRWVQNVTARDHSVVNAVQHGTQHNHYMNPVGPDPAAAPADDESAG